MIYLRQNPVLGLLALTLAYAGVSILWSPGDKLWATILLASFAVAFALGTWLKDLRPIWATFIAFTIANIPFLFFGSFGLYGNPNFFGCALALAIAGSIVFHLWLFIPFCVLGLLSVAPPPRGAVLATGLAGLVSLWRHHRVAALLVLGLAIAVALALPKADGTILMRLGVWQDTLNHLTIFGHGFGSFFNSYATWPIHTNMTGVQPNHAYNDALELMFDLGIGVIPFWIALIMLWERPNVICWTFLALSLTYFPLFIVPVGQMFFLTLGQLYKERQSYGPLEVNAAPLSQCARYGVGV